MEPYIDIHSHILPKIDDGAENIEMSLKMMEIAQENGIGKIILTPHNKPGHHNANPEKIWKLTEKLKSEAKARGVAVQLYTGNEIYYRSDIVEMLERKEACTMAGSSYVLLEFNPMDDFDYIRQGIYQVLSSGFRPILAHAERYESLTSSIKKVDGLVEMGCYIQVNAGSITGDNGFAGKHFTRLLLKRELVHFVATDAHSDRRRGPYMKKCGEYLEKKMGQDYARRLLKENPAYVIADMYI